jgi:hypothetical protein
LIITSPDLRPSQRFIEVIKEYFLANGYTFKKSAKTFVKDFESGKQEVLLSFLNLSGGTEVELHWGLTYPKLEKLFAISKGWTKKMETGPTFGTELNNLPEIKYSKQLYSFPLYDNQTFKVDDFSVNKTAEAYIDAFKEYAVPFFEHYKKLGNVEKQLNKLPIDYPVITNWRDKHILFGLLLASYFSKENYSAIVESYNEYIGTMYDRLQAELKEYLNKAEDLISTIEVSELLK